MAATAGTTAPPPPPSTTKPVVAETGSPALAKLEKYWKPLSYAAGAVAVVAVGLWLLSVSSRRKEQMGLDALDGARGAMEAGNIPGASAEFQRIIQSFGGTDAAYQAQLGLNTARLASGQAQLAADELKKFADSNPPAFYASGALSLLGSALENLRKYDEAAAAYLQSAQRAEEDYRKVEAELAAARAYRLAGKDKEALDVFRGIVSKYSKEVPGVPEANVRLAELTRGGM